MKKSFKKILLILFPKKSKEEIIDEFASGVVRDLYSEDLKFTLEEKTEVIHLIQKKQFQILENKASEIEAIQNEMDSLIILSVNE